MKQQKQSAKTNWLLENEQLADNIKEARLFKGLSNEFFEKLLTQSEVVHFPKETVIIREGQFNKYLYFILQGKVSITSGGEHLLDFGRVGDIFGETSIITEPVFFFSVIASTNVLLLRLDIEDHENNDQESLALFIQECTQIVNRALVEKLKIFIQKAKQLQVVSRQLSDTRAILNQFKQEVQKQEYQAASVVESLPDLLIYLSQDGKILKIKPGMNPKLHFDHQKYLGKNIAELNDIPAPLKELAMSTLIDAVESQENKTVIFQLPDDSKQKSYEARVIIINQRDLLILIRLLPLDNES